MISLGQAAASIGANVVYRPHAGAPAEDGTIVSVNDRYVMVLYLGDRAPKATSPADLTFLGPARESARVR